MQFAAPRHLRRAKPRSLAYVLAMAPGTTAAACPACATPVDDSHRFCPGCGKSLDVADRPDGHGAAPHALARASRRRPLGPPSASPRA